MNLRPAHHPWRFRGRTWRLGRVLLLGPALVLALCVALPAAPALAQSPEPSVTATATTGPMPEPSPTATTASRWLLYLPSIHQPVKELLLGQEARVGGAAMGIASDGGFLLQVQGASLHSSVPEGQELTYRGAFDLLDPAPVDDAWLSLEGGLVTYLRQLRERVPGEPRQLGQ